MLGQRSRSRLRPSPSNTLPESVTHNENSDDKELKIMCYTGRYNVNYQPINEENENISSELLKEVIEVITLEDDDGDKQKVSENVELKVPDECQVLDDEQQCKDEDYPRLMDDRCSKCSESLTHVIANNELSTNGIESDHRAHITTIRNSLTDSVKFKAYEKVLNENAHLIKDKIVLNVQSGVGLLALMAVKAGAKMVIAIDSSQVIDMTRILVKDLKLEHKIAAIHGSVENVTLPVDKVDVIISDWMGFALLYQSSLELVIAARDKWLKPNGVILPDVATLMIIGITDNGIKDHNVDLRKSMSLYTRHVTWWNDVYGFNYRSVKPKVIEEPCFYACNVQQQITNSFLLKEFDLYKITIEEMRYINTEFELRVNRNDYVHMFGLYYDIHFMQKPIRDKVTFTTAPNQNKFKQTLLFINRSDCLTVLTDDIINGHIKIVMSKNCTKMDIAIDLKFNNQLCHTNKSFNYSISR